MPYVSIPRIESAAVTPNPAEINGAAALLVAVAEQQVWVAPPVVYAGELYAGEHSSSAEC